MNRSHRQAAAIGSSATRRLAEVQRIHGLSARTLRVLSQNLDVVAQSDYQPSLERFRLDVAEPRRRLFAAESGLVLTDAVRLVNDLVNEMSQISETSDDSDATAKAQVVQSFDQALFLPQHVVRLGNRWHWQLRMRTAVTVVLNVPQNSALPSLDEYRSTQLSIVDSAPWSFQDRLLSAYEAADREVMELRRRLVSQLFDAVGASDAADGSWLSATDPLRPVSL